MTNRNLALGRTGENIAADYLERNGYKIICRNFKCRFGELDIIAEKEDVLFFVEVKTASSNSFHYPEEAVTFRKRGHMAKSAEYFLGDYPDDPPAWQFDILAITLFPGQEPQILHLENVII